MASALLIASLLRCDKRRRNSIGDDGVGAGVVVVVVVVVVVD